MTTAEIVNLYNGYVMPTYGRSLAIVRGKGARCWDADGREYLDFGGGVAVNDTTGNLRYGYMGEVFGLLESIKLDFYHEVNEPYENDVRARAGTVWECIERLPGHHGNAV